MSDNSKYPVHLSLHTLNEAGGRSIGRQWAWDSLPYLLAAILTAIGIGGVFVLSLIMSI
jgi:hypothetical protein